ncbi:MAG: hypothetical protein LBL07_10425 [Tannerella sp.]|jgi:hypothetical protein|nr:hypothetical protein [Tannerella sp.]
MKRIFIIDGFEKEAPAQLKETPAKGTVVYYNTGLYQVSEIIYRFEDNIITIHLSVLYNEKKMD